MTTILGKRTRSTSTAARPSTPSLTPSPKRARITASSFDKENVRPGPLHETRKTPRKNAAFKVAIDPIPATPTKQLSTLTLSTPPPTPHSNHARARALLRSSSTTPVIGRDSERATIQQFIDEFVSGKTHRENSSLYISGGPGTGKTFLVSDVLRDITSRTAVKTVYINCVGLLQEALWSRFTEIVAGVHDKTPLERALIKSSTKWVLTLDEMDHLLNTNSTIFDILSTASKYSKYLCIIGISNTHTLTTTTVPQTTTLHFAPYSAPQMLEIITSRLSIIAADIVQPKALELSCKKIAAQTGDIRACMDVVRRALECAEREQTKNNSSEVICVGLKHVLEGMKGDVGKAQGVVGLVRGLALQQRLVLLSLVLATRRLSQGLSLVRSFASGKENISSKGLDCSPAALHASYTAMLSSSSVFGALSRNEFTDILGILETSGLLSHTVRGKDWTVSLPSGVREDEVIRGLTTSAVDGIEGPMEVEVRSMFERENTRITRELEKKRLGKRSTRVAIDGAYER